MGGNHERRGVDSNAGSPLAVLQCTSRYPTDLAEVDSMWWKSCMSASAYPLAYPTIRARSSLRWPLWREERISWRFT